VDRSEAEQMRREMIQMREDYDLMNERFLRKDEEHQRDKQFYEEAPEARMNQLE
jgi:hypothetical protein